MYLFVLMYLMSFSAECEDKLVVALSNFSPWTVVEGRKVTGIDIELIDAMTANQPIKVEYFRCPWARCLELMRQGKIDLASNLFWSAERAAFLDYFKQPYVQGSYRAFYLHRSSGATISNYEDLSSLAIGTRIGMRYFEKFDQDIQLKKVPLATDAQLIEMLKHQRLDAMIGQEDVIDYMLLTSKLTREITKAKFKHFVAEPGYMVMSKKSSVLHLKTTLEERLNHLVASGHFAELVEKYR